MSVMPLYVNYVYICLQNIVCLCAYNFCRQYYVDADNIQPFIIYLVAWRCPLLRHVEGNRTL